MARRPTLLIIDPATEVPEEQGVVEVTRDWSGDVRVLQPALRGDGPGPGDDYEGVDGVVVFGSAASVYDDHAWLRSLSSWMRPIVRGDVDLPLFGICFGHQLVAHLAGGRVGYLRPDESKLVAYEETTVGGRLLGDEGVSLRVIASHREEVKEVPSDYRVVGARATSRHDVLEHAARPIHTVQFHPEARDRFARRIGLDVAGVDERLQASSQRLLGAFRREVVAHARGSDEQ